MLKGNATTSWKRIDVVKVLVIRVTVQEPHRGCLNDKETIIVQNIGFRFVTKSCQQEQLVKFCLCKGVVMKMVCIIFIDTLKSTFDCFNLLFGLLLTKLLIILLLNLQT